MMKGRQAKLVKIHVKRTKLCTFANLLHSMERLKLMDHLSAVMHCIWGKGKVSPLVVDEEFGMPCTQEMTLY